MRLIIHGKHLAVTPAIKNHTEKKISKIKKYFNNILEVDVTLSAEHKKSGDFHTADVLVFMHGHKVRASATDTDLYAAIDEVVEVLEKQITKYKEKLRDNHHNTHSETLKTFKYNPDTKTVEKNITRKVVDSQVFVKPMSVEEAILQLEVTNQDFYIFMNSDTEEMNVIHKRKDGNYGHVVPGWK